MRAELDDHIDRAIDNLPILFASIYTKFGTPYLHCHILDADDIRHNLVAARDHIDAAIRLCDHGR